MIERAFYLARSLERAKLARFFLQQRFPAKLFNGALPCCVRDRWMNHPILESHSIPTCKLIS
jgi:hypothetical protein